MLGSTLWNFKKHIKFIIPMCMYKRTFPFASKFSEWFDLYVYKMSSILWKENAMKKVQQLPICGCHELKLLFINHRYRSGTL